MQAMGETPRWSKAPTLSTERLILRSFRPEDFPAFTALHADEEVMRYISGGRALPPDQAWTIMAVYLGHWMLRGYGKWALAEKQTGEFVGRCGLWRPEGWPGLEVGWAVRRDRWGLGYATEAARETVRFARRYFSNDLVSLIQPGNAASVRVAEKLGARRVGDVEIYGQKMDIFKHPDHPASET